MTFESLDVERGKPCVPTQKRVCSLFEKVGKKGSIRHRKLLDTKMKRLHTIDGRRLDLLGHGVEIGLVLLACAHASGVGHSLKGCEIGTDILPYLITPPHHDLREQRRGAGD